MADMTKTAVDFNKSDGIPAVKFSPEFLQSFDASITSYDTTLEQLQSLVNGKGFEDEYGICNCRYEMRYITPNDISTYISNLLKAISMRLITCDISDLEKFSVEMAKQFIAQNTGNTIDRENIFAMSKYSDPRVQTLMELLVETENTFFDRCVYSKYEMQKRAKEIKPDYDKINGMHFGPSMKAVVKALPEIIKKNMDESADKFVCCNCDTVMTYIETFILFACGLNTCMLTQLIGYCEPMTTCLRKEGQVVTQESVSTRGSKPVYVVLVSGTNIVSQTIKKFTNSKWSHAAISFDPSLEEMYSYTFATTEYAPASQGLRRESIKLLNNINGEVCVYGFYAPNKTVENMKEEIQNRIKSGKTKYDLGLLFKKAFNDEAEENVDKNKKICSAFVNSFIGEFIGKISDKNSPSPDDVFQALQTMNSHEFTKLYEGPCMTYDPAAVTTHLKKFAKEGDTKRAFTEYVSEFCLVKTNDINIRARIPFDFNMRNIVLQDCTPNLKDTRSALHFMLKDTRSPIHAMLIESATEKRIPDRLGCSSTLQMFEPYFHPMCPDRNGPLGPDYEFVDFHTDVNWLDKIAYGNNFLDGNYRMDAMGNDNRHPIYLTLCTLHRMYCGCSLKTNEELANNILKIAGVMLSIIDTQPWMCYNKDLVKDILAVLGECFTRNVIKLYNNHCAIVTYSDDMNDTMIPGYTYCEAFVYMEAEGEKPAPATVTFQNQSGQAVNTYSKNGVLNKLTSIMRQFAQWITNKFAQIPGLFEKINGAKANYVVKHKELNQEIANAIGQGTFQPQLTNFPRYKIPLDEINKKTDGVKNALDDYLKNRDAEINVEKIKAEIYPGNQAAEIASLKDPKKEAEQIRNYVLFSNVQPQYWDNGAMKIDAWNDMCNDLSNSARLVQEASKTLVKSLQDGIKVLEALRKKEENEAKNEGQQTNTQATQQGAQQANGQQQQQGSKTEQLLKLFQQIAQTYQINVINAITNTFFNTYYSAYRDIVANYQMQSKSKVDQQAASASQQT